MPLREIPMHERIDQFEQIREANQKRDAAWDPEGKIGILFRSTEFGGEAGEVQNQVKKLEREQMGLKGSRTTIQALMKEVGDTLITLDLICMVYNIDMWECARYAFNKTSKEQGFEVML